MNEGEKCRDCGEKGKWGSFGLCAEKKCYVGAELLKKNSLLYKCYMLRLRRKVCRRPKK